MKTIINKLAGKFYLVALFATGTLIMISCSTKDNGTGQELPNGKSQILVNASSVTDNETIVSKMSKAGTSASIQPSQQSVEMITGNGFDAIVAVDRNLPANTAINNKSTLASAGNRAAALTPGTTYRLFFI